MKFYVTKLVATMAAGRVLMMLLARIVWQTYSCTASENVRSAAADNSIQPPSPEGLELQYVTGAVSGRTTPGSVTSESSYDPANDTDLDCIGILLTDHYASPLLPF